MNNTWHFLKNLANTDSQEISADAVITSDSLWFDGHFPFSPILPGIAELALVYDAIREYARKQDGDIAIIAVKKIRFRQFIRPGDVLQISAVPEGGDHSTYRFRVMVNGQVACSGLMLTALREMRRV